MATDVRTKNKDNDARVRDRHRYVGHLTSVAKDMSAVHRALTCDERRAYVYASYAAPRRISLASTKPPPLASGRESFDNEASGERRRSSLLEVSVCIEALSLGRPTTSSRKH